MITTNQYILKITKQYSLHITDFKTAANRSVIPTDGHRVSTSDVSGKVENSPWSGLYPRSMESRLHNESSHGHDRLKDSYLHSKRAAFSRPRIGLSSTASILKTGNERLESDGGWDIQWFVFGIKYIMTLSQVSRHLWTCALARFPMWTCHTLPFLTESTPVKPDYISGL